MKSAKKKTQLDLLKENAEEVIKLMSENVSYAEISKKFSVHVTAIVEFTNRSEYSARAKEALKISSYFLLQEAENHLKEMIDDSTSAKVRRCSELSQFKVYLAKTKNRVELDLNYKDKEEDKIIQMPEIIINLTK